MNWELLWKVVFIVVLSVFAVMSVLVTWRGARDIKKMLSDLKSDEDSQESKRGS